MELNNTYKQIAIFRTPPLTIAEHSFFSSVHEIFTKIDHAMGHKTNLNKFKKIQTIHSMVFDCNEIKLEINNSSLENFQIFVNCITHF